MEELIKCDNALAQIREMNKNHLTILLDRCRKDYYQQTIRNKLDKVNTQVGQINIYIITQYFIIMFIFL